MTNTFRPDFSPPDAAGLLADVLAAAEEELLAAVLAGGVEELEELELQADSATVAATGRASASHVARLSCILLYPFNFESFEGCWRRAS
jgi:hypothetical protein